MGILDILHNDGSCNARTGILHLPHGDVETPVFMPVGTLGGIKAIYHKTVEDIGFRLILGNTYHLYLQPGCEVLDGYGGLHGFSSWKHNLLTDSGGFQIFSLSKLRKITENGAEFHSHIDGSRHLFTPEKVIDIEGVIGSDIAMCLDYCTEPDISYKDAAKAMDITHRWAERCVSEYDRLKSEGGKRPGTLFGIIQGNFYEDLRKRSAQFISSLPFDGLAIGGLSVGEKSDVFKHFLQFTADVAPMDRPRYVMGIGTPEYIFEAVENGIDMFDCVLATRVARHGSVFTDDGMINITKSAYRLDRRPIVEGCTCTCCQQYSRGYLQHMFRAGESLAGMLATEHNLTYFYNLMQRIRQAVNEDDFKSFKKDYLCRFSSGKK